MKQRGAEMKRETLRAMLEKRRYELSTADCPDRTVTMPTGEPLIY